MADMTGKSPAETYKDLLQVSNSNNGVDGTLRDVEDGEGTVSALQVSTTDVNVNGGLELQVSTLNQVATPATPSTGKVAVYAKTDGLVYSKDESGVETLMSSGAGVSGGGSVQQGGLLAGAYQFTALVPEVNSFLNSGSGSVGVPQLTPFDVKKTETYTRMGARNTSASGVDGMRIALYDSGDDGMPNLRLAESGNIDCTSAGDKEVTINVELTGGKRYWIGVVKRKSMNMNLFNDPLNASQHHGTKSATAFYSYLSNNAWTGVSDEFTTEITAGTVTSSQIQSGDPIATWLRWGV